MIDASHGGESDEERRRKIETTLDDVRRAKPEGEALLFHYTPREFAKLICAGGFRSSTWGLQGEGVYLSELSPVSMLNGAQWPAPAFREQMLKANYGAAWADENRRCAVDCVLICCVDRSLLRPVEGRTGAFKVDTKIIESFGGDPSLHGKIKKCFALYDSANAPGMAAHAPAAKEAAAMAEATEADCSERGAPK